MRQVSETRNDLDLERLKQNTDRILQELLIRKPLVKAGEWLQSHLDLKSRFDRAGVLYRVGSFGEAMRLFREVASSADEQKTGMVRTPLINAAACAAAMEDFQGVLEIVRPMYERNVALGYPLWNLALAYYQLGEIPQALTAIQRWTQRAYPSEKAGGRLVAAGLAIKVGNLTLAANEFDAAKEADKAFVSKHLIGRSSGQVTLGRFPTPTPARARHVLSEPERMALL